MKQWDVYVYGDVNIDLIIPGADQIPPPGQEWDVPLIRTVTGGGAALFTMGLGKLGLHPVFQGTVGNDCYGKYILDSFREQNVDCTLLTVSEEIGTGVSISFTNEKDRSFLTYKGTNADLDIHRIEMREVQKARHIHVTGYSGTKSHPAYLTLLQKIKRETDATVSFDLGWDDTGEWNPGIYELFPYIDVLFMNETESIHYSRKNTAKEAAADFAGHCGLVVLKLGKKGSLAMSEGRIYEKEGFQVEVKDTTGAGDSFNAGFIYGFLCKASIEESLCYGNGCGALSCTGVGGNSAFPTKEELVRFMGQQRRKV